MAHIPTHRTMPTPGLRQQVSTIDIDEENKMLLPAKQEFLVPITAYLNADRPDQHGKKNLTNRKLWQKCIGSARTSNQKQYFGDRTSVK